MFLVLALLLASTDPSAAIAEGRRLTAAHDCAGAVRVLQDAVPAASALADAKQRGDALAALHFYTAVAFQQCGNVAEAKIALREFFRFRPDAAKLDPAKYDAAFIRLFDEAHAKAASAADASFDRFYSGYNGEAQPVETPHSIALWGSAAEFALLATRDERHQWERLPDDEARLRFEAEFWKRRDRDPATEANEYRAEIVRRVAFADHAFRASNEERGSLTDRGRVFVLLGVPARVSRMPLTRSRGATIPRRSVLQIDGVEERWIYSREQLPEKLPALQVVFRFITQEGYGENVMQKEPLALKTLAAAVDLAIIHE